MIMRELMIKLIICLMIMFACVSCSSDDELNEYTRQRCLVDDIEMKWGAENVLFEHREAYNDHDLWVSQNIILNTYMLQQTPYLKTPTKIEDITSGAIYAGFFEGDSVIVYPIDVYMDNVKVNMNNEVRIWVSCKHHHKCSYHD